MSTETTTDKTVFDPDKLDEAFTLPQALLEVLQLIDGEDASSRKLADAIMRDPSLTAKILKMANSSYYKRGMDVSTVNQAVMMLGWSMVKCLALSVSIFKPDEALSEREDFDIRELYTHFIGVAIAARSIAEETGYKKPEEAFIAGLLHDFGHLYFLKNNAEMHIPMIAESFQSQELCEIERKAYGFNHAEVGAAIARKWGLPECLVSAISSHHVDLVENPDFDANQLDMIVMPADHTNLRSHSEEKRNVEQHLRVVSDLRDRLGLSDTFVTELGFRLLNEIVEAASFLGISIGDPIKLLQKANKELFDSFVTIESLFKERRELSRRVIEEERRAGAIKSKNIAIATLSHYINNAATIISGRIQLVQLMVGGGELNDPGEKLTDALGVIDGSLSKIMVVLSELKDLTSLDDVKFYSNSDAIDIDERVRKRMAAVDMLEDLMTDEEPPDFD